MAFLKNHFILGEGLTMQQLARLRAHAGFGLLRLRPCAEGAHEVIT